MGDVAAPLIFIVDDNHYYVEFIKQDLNNHDFYNIREYNSSEEFLDNLHRNPDFIIMDYEIDEYNGIDLLQITKEKFPDANVILLSGSLEENLKTEALENGALDYLVKNHEAFEMIRQNLNSILAKTM